MDKPDFDTRTGWADRPWWILLILLPGLWALLARPLTPLEETRAAGVAWEMWLRGDFLVPHMNGMPYSHKPPLLFWLMHLGWSVFGVNDWWPKLVGPLATLGATALTWRLAGEIWPQDQRVRQLTAWLIGGSLGWILYGQMLMYDTLLTACVLIALIGAWRAGSTGSRSAWALVACGIGLGVLAKGPVALLHVMIPVLLAPLWSQRARQKPLAWYSWSLLALLGGTLIAGTWAGLAALYGGDEYARMILLEQTSGRVVKSFAHERPWWVYLVFMPALALPWVLLPGTWRGLLGDNSTEGRRFLLCWALGSLFVLSLVSGKQPHYAIPELPAVMLLIAGGLSTRYSTRKVAVRAILTALVLLTIATAIFAKRYADFDMVPAARLTSSLQKSGVPVATMRDYKNQLTFPGRLEQPLPELQRDQVGPWFQQHPDGVVVTQREELPESLGLEVFERFPYRGGETKFWRLEGSEP
jgi:4-amino-4-deoxy-L-arabinose transferase-like glycosyltransferase